MKAVQYILLADVSLYDENTFLLKEREKALESHCFSFVYWIERQGCLVPGAKEKECMACIL